MSTNAEDCFDYIMNTQSTYKHLGVVVGLFERSRARSRATVAQELRMIQGKGGARPWSTVGLKRWYRELLAVIGAARRDAIKNFPDEQPEWLDSVDWKDVLTIAVENADRFE